jgi:ribosomal protein S18 acetylase RimI-like enzyme
VEFSTWQKPVRIRESLVFRVWNPYVDLAYRGQGVGTRLSEVTFEAARRKGYEKLFTYVRADNLESLAFYLKLGFRIVGTAQMQARFGQKYVDEVIIEKFL